MPLEKNEQPDCQKNLERYQKNYSICSIVLNVPFCPIKQKLRRNESEVSMVKIPQHKVAKWNNFFGTFFAFLRTLIEIPLMWPFNFYYQQIKGDTRNFRQTSLANILLYSSLRFSFLEVIDAIRTQTPPQRCLSAHQISIFVFS